MAIPLSCAAKLQSTKSSSSIYVAATPLRATTGPAQTVMSTAYSLNLWDMQHFMVVIKPTSPPQSQVFFFDFQPRDPEDIFVALAALSGRGVPGAVLVRKLTKLPNKKCWLVGSSNEDIIDRAKRFSDRWHTELKIGQHDCRDYTNGLVECLTGEKRVLERLRRCEGS